MQQIVLGGISAKLDMATLGSGRQDTELTADLPGEAGNSFRIRLTPNPDLEEDEYAVGVRDGNDLDIEFHVGNDAWVGDVEYFIEPSGPGHGDWDPPLGYHISRFGVDSERVLEETDGFGWTSFSGGEDGGYLDGAEPDGVLERIGDVYRWSGNVHAGLFDVAALGISGFVNILNLKIEASGSTGWHVYLVAGVKELLLVEGVTEFVNLMNLGFMNPSHKLKVVVDDAVGGRVMAIFQSRKHMRR